MLITLQVEAQDHHLHLQKIGMEDGLSSYNIRHFFQDSRGFLWLATDYGLNRYDGQSIKVYTKEESGLCGNGVLYLLEDASKKLWIHAVNEDHTCTCIFDPDQERFYSIAEYTGSQAPFNEQYATFSVPSHQNAIIFKDQQSKIYYELDGKQYTRLFEELDLKNEYAEFATKACYKLSNHHYALFIQHPNMYQNRLLHLDKKGNILKKDYCPPNLPELLLFSSYPEPYCLVCRDYSKPDYWTVQIALVLKSNLLLKN